MGLFSNRSQLTLSCVFLLFQGGGDCSCQAGLTCMLTKNMIYNGQVIPVKQCMPEGMDIEVEEVDLDNQSADEPMRTKRFLFNVRILITFIFALRDQDSRKREGGGRERSLRGGEVRCLPNLHKNEMQFLQKCPASA